jgi:hypothetical protein
MENGNSNYENHTIFDLFHENVKYTYKMALSDEDLIERYNLNRKKKSKNESDDDAKLKDQVHNKNSSTTDKSSSIYKIIQENVNSNNESNIIMIDRALIEKGFNILS